MTTENKDGQEKEPVETTTDTTLEESLANISEEDIDKYDNFESFLAEQNPQTNEPEPEPNPSEPEQSNVEQTETTPTDTGSENTLSDTEFRQLVTSTFRANHKDFQIEDPEEIRKLMSFGMNYHKKMNELAPHRRALKTLEQQGLLDPDKLNYAIELLQGNKGAIAKLLKEHSVDTYELPDLEEQPYQTGNYLPSQERINFDDKVDSLKETEHGNQVIEFIKGLDSDSFYEIYSNPEMMDMLQSHVQSGLYQDASNFLEKERALGKVPANVKDIDAYAFVAEHLQKTNPSKYAPVQQQRVIGNNLQNTQVKQPSSNAKLNAGIPNNSGSRQQQQSFSGIDLLLNASDEDLAKYDNWEQFIASNNLNF